MNKPFIHGVFTKYSFLQIASTLRLLTIIMAFFALGTVQAQDSGHKLPFLSPETSYLWPTDASDYMSATFGETRAAHFHAAIDIGTWGQQGFRVFASRDGLLSRVGVSPTGYGNVVYLKHDDGTYSIYAHLRDFIPQIREIVDEIRFRDYRFEFDENLEHLDIRFNKGDLIAFSGDTGIGPPHLHFELRSPLNNPFNPLLAGITVPDRVPPRISGVSVEPISKDAMVNGRKRIQTIPVRGSGRNFEFGTITASGTIGLGVEASDRADAMRNVYAVYELKLTINDSLFFHSKADSFEIGTSRMMFLDRVYPVLRAERKGYQRLFIRDGNTIPFYRNVGHNGMVKLPEGTYQVRIEAADFFGNRSVATGRLRIVPPDTGNPLELSSDPTLKPKVPEGNRGLPRSFGNIYWTNDWFTSLNPASAMLLTLRSPESFMHRTGSVRLNTLETAVNLQNMPLLFATLGGEPMILHRVEPGKTTHMRTPDQRLQLEFRPTTLYDTMTVAFAWKKQNGRIYIETGPDHEPFRSGYVLRFLLDESMINVPGLGLYSVNNAGNRESYAFISGNIIHGAISTVTTHMGTFTILSDTTPPQITRPRIYRRSDGKWFASVRVTDDLSGIHFQDAEFYVNGVRGIAEFDPFAGILIYHLPGFNPRATNNEIHVKLRDRAGNWSEARFRTNRS